MNEENVVYTYNGMLFSLNTEGNPAILTMGMNLENSILSERSQSRREEYCMTPLM